MTYVLRRTLEPIVSKLPSENYAVTNAFRYIVTPKNICSTPTNVILLKKT